MKMNKWTMGLAAAGIVSLSSSEANYRAKPQPHRAEKEREHRLVRKHVPTVGQFDRPLLRARPLALIVV